MNQQETQTRSWVCLARPEALGKRVCRHENPCTEVRCARCGMVQEGGIEPFRIDPERQPTIERARLVFVALERAIAARCVWKGPHNKVPRVGMIELRLWRAVADEAAALLAAAGGTSEVDRLRALEALAQTLGVRG